MNGDHPVTRAELQSELSSLEEKLIDKMRQMETSMLTAFHSYARGVSSHLHTLDTGDYDLRTRIAVLEDRVLALENRQPPAV